MRLWESIGPRRRHPSDLDERLSHPSETRPPSDPNDRECSCHLHPNRPTTSAPRPNHGRWLQCYPQRKTVATSPGDPTRRPDALKTSHQQHAETGAWWDRGPAQVAVVIRTALLLDPTIQPRLRENLIEFSIEDMPFGFRQVGGGHPHLLLFASSLSQRHRHCLLRLTMAMVHSCSETCSTGC
jgi:hypothetical protein